MLTVRLTFEYRSGRVQLVSRDDVDMTPPPSDALSAEGESGFWYELRGRSGRPVYRGVANSPTRSWMEVPNQDGSLSSVEVENPRTVFVLLVPHLEEARTLVLFASPQLPPIGGEPAVEIARFSLE
jgi:hypothetical protein